MHNITQDMKHKQSLMCCALRFGVARAARKYNRCRSYIYRWLKRYDD
ncbi:MAG: helix-turn-helix domain-containing protein [Bacillota bacterium]